MRASDANVDAGLRRFRGRVTWEGRAGLGRQVRGMIGGLTRDADIQARALVECSRPINDIRCRELVALKRAVSGAPVPPTGSPQQWAYGGRRHTEQARAPSRAPARGSQLQAA